MTDIERVYDLGDDRDRAAIIAEISAMRVDTTLTYLLASQPLQGDLGKVGYKAGRGRDAEAGNIVLDLVETDLGLMLYATCSLLSED